MGIARSTYYRASRGSADDTALVEAMHAIKDEFEARDRSTLPMPHLPPAPHNPRPPPS